MRPARVLDDLRGQRPHVVGTFAADGRRGLSDHEIRDQLVQLYGGHRSARVAQSWTLYQLAKHPDVQARLHEEVDSVLGDRIAGGDDFHRLPYTRKVLCEALRCYPPVWVLTRAVLRDVPVYGGTLPAGSMVLISQWVVHHDPRWYPDPERFDPERFSDDAIPSRPEHAFFPFGAGKRGCVGSAFAWLEGVLLLASIAQRWRISLVPGCEPEPQMRVTLRPKHRVLLHLERRTERVVR